MPLLLKVWSMDEQHRYHLGAHKNAGSQGSLIIAESDSAF